MQLDPREIRLLTKMLAPQNKKELQVFLGIINYLSKILSRHVKGVQSTKKTDVE